MSKCSKGMIRRKGYTAIRHGKKVKVGSKCIRATSASGSKRSTKDKRYLNRRAKIQKSMAKKYGSKKCPKGQIERAGFTRKGYGRRAYTRKSGSKVSATHVARSETAPVCINRRGLGKGFKIPMHLEKGVLKKFGYSNVKNMTASDRHAALRDAVEHIPSLSVFRKLVGVSTLERNTDPKASGIFKTDAAWVRSTFGLLRKKKASGSKTAKKRSKPRSAKKSKSKTSKRRSMSGGKKTARRSKSKTAKKSSKKSPKRSSKSKTRKTKRTSRR